MKYIREYKTAKPFRGATVIPAIGSLRDHFVQSAKPRNYWPKQGGGFQFLALASAVVATALPLSVHSRTHRKSSATSDIFAPGVMRGALRAAPVLAGRLRCLFKAGLPLTWMCRQVKLCVSVHLPITFIEQGELWSFQAFSTGGKTCRATFLSEQELVWNLLIASPARTISGPTLRPSGGGKSSLAFSKVNPLIRDECCSHPELGFQGFRRGTWGCVPIFISPIGM